MRTDFENPLSSGKNESTTRVAAGALFSSSWFLLSPLSMSAFKLIKTESCNCFCACTLKSSEELVGWELLSRQSHAHNVHAHHNPLTCPCLDFVKTYLHHTINSNVYLKKNHIQCTTIFVKKRMLCFRNCKKKKALTWAVKSK